MANFIKCPVLYIFNINTRIKIKYGNNNIRRLMQKRIGDIRKKNRQTTVMEKRGYLVTNNSL